MFVVTILVGFIVGVVMLSLGGGGGAVYLGLLTTVFLLPPPAAVATSIITSFPALVLGCFSYYRRGLINFHIGNHMLMAAVPSVIIGSLVSPWIPLFIYHIIIGVILAFLGIGILRQLYGKKKKRPKNGNQKTSLIYGVLAGLMVGIGGLSGGGAITAGLLLMGASLTRMAATSSYVLVVMSFIGGALHVSGGNVDWKVAFGLIIGSLVGSFLAPSVVIWLSKNPKRVLIVKTMLGILLILMGLRTAFMA